MVVLVPHEEWTKKARTKSKFGKEEVMIGTWNVRTCLSIDDNDRLSLDLLKYRVLVCALQEVRWDKQKVVERHGVLGWWCMA